MTIFRKVFDNKSPTSKSQRFERVSQPHDVSIDDMTDLPEMTMRAAISDPVSPEPPRSEPAFSNPIIADPAPAHSPQSTPINAPAPSVSSHPHSPQSQPAQSRPTVSQPTRYHPMAAQAGPEKVAGPIFGIGHQEEPAAETTVNTSVPRPGFQHQTASQPTTTSTPVSEGSAPSAGTGASRSEPSVQVAPAVQPNAGAARTRLLGFHRSQPIKLDPLGDLSHEKVHVAELFPTGWVAITAGPGEGNALPVHNRVCVIGRGEDQDIRLDFGDTSISRDKHAAIAFDDEDCKFYLGHGGKSNLIRLNGRPVLSTEELCHGDTIRIGETTLRFAALCGADFTWNGQQDDC